MNIPLDLPSSIYGWFAVVAFIISGILFIRRNDIKGIRENADELRKELGDKQRLILDLQSQLNAFKEELAKLRGILEEKDKRIDALSKVQVVQQASPESLVYQQDIRNFMSQVHEYMVGSTKSLTEINQKVK